MEFAPNAVPMGLALAITSEILLFVVIVCDMTISFRAIPTVMLIGFLVELVVFTATYRHDVKPDSIPLGLAIGFLFEVILFAIIATEVIRSPRRQKP